MGGKAVIDEVAGGEEEAVRVKKETVSEDMKEKNE